MLFDDRSIFLPAMRTGIEAVVFVGGVSLGQPATSIPIAAIVGLVCGFVCGWLIYAFASRTSKTFHTGLNLSHLMIHYMAALTIFLVVMTNFILLIGAGLFTKAVSAFQSHAYVPSFSLSLLPLLTHPRITHPLSSIIILGTRLFSEQVQTTQAGTDQDHTMLGEMYGI